MGQLRVRPEFQESWIEGDDSARWRTSFGHGPRGGARESGSSLLEIERGRRLPRHVDSAEEAIVATAGKATVSLGEEQDEVTSGDIVLVPAGVPHEVRNTGEESLRFAAVYADTDVVTTYDVEVQPDGSRERRSVR
jgi:quercetin dioxygenase-like cupin family protein